MGWSWAIGVAVLTWLPVPALSLVAYYATGGLDGAWRVVITSAAAGLGSVVWRELNHHRWWAREIELALTQFQRLAPGSLYVHFQVRPADAERAVEVLRRTGLEAWIEDHEWRGWKNVTAGRTGPHFGHDVEQEARDALARTDVVAQRTGSTG